LPEDQILKPEMLSYFKDYQKPFCGKKCRKGRKPSTGEDLILDGRRVVTFRCSPILREKMNSDGKE
jgi:hypothetical protein